MDRQHSSDQAQLDDTRRGVDLGRFRCKVIPGGLGGSWVEVTGDLDLRSAPYLEQHLLTASATARLVVLDLRDLAFIDCSGVHVILKAYGRLRREDRRLIVLRGPAHVDRVFALTATEGELEFLDVGAAAPTVRKLQRLGTGPEARGLHLVEAPRSPDDRPERGRVQTPTMD